MNNMKKKLTYGKTPIGMIPKEWEVILLKQICEMERGFSYRSNQLTDEETGICFITINNIKKEGGTKNTPRLYLKNTIEVDSKFYVDKNSLFIANTDMTKGYIIGAPLLIKDMKTRFIFSMDLTRLLIKSNNLSMIFLFYLLSHQKIRNFMKRNSHGTNVLHLNHQLVGELKLPLPPLLEQKKIAEILLTVDQAIEEVDKSISKTERLKKGLMQEFLTKGIGHKEFKETEIGRIPKEWTVKSIIDLFKVETGTTPSTKKREHWDNGSINWITPADMSGLNGKIYIKESERKITKKALKEANLTLMPSDSIIISTRAPVGYVAIIKNNATFNQGCKGLIPKRTGEINVEFYTHYLLSKKESLEYSSGGSTFKELSKYTLEKFKIPLPPLSEQKKIADILSTVNERMELLKEKKEKLDRVKKGLMNDLLTGKRRVKINFKQGE